MTQVTKEERAPVHCRGAAGVIVPSDPLTAPAVFEAGAASQPRHVHLSVGGVLLHWVEFAPSAEEQQRKAAVVLLHGLNDSHLTWRKIAPELARDRRVFVLDLPGHGHSERPDVGYELAWYAEIVARWIEALGLEPHEQVDIVGHSLGGGIAMVLLKVCRPRIRRLVLAAPGGLGKEITFLLRLASIPGVERFGQPFMGFGTHLALRRWRTKLPSGHIAELSAMNSQRGTARAFARTVRGLMDWSGQRHSFYRHAHEVSQLPPIAVLWGETDAVLPIAHGKTLAKAIVGVRLTELKGCGHYLHHDDPRSFLAGVQAALDAPLWPPVYVTAAATASGRAEGLAATSWRAWLGSLRPRLGRAISTFGRTRRHQELIQASIVAPIVTL